VKPGTGMRDPRRGALLPSVAPFAGDPSLSDVTVVMMRGIKSLVAALSCLLCGLPGLAPAEPPGSADLNISPKRLVFDVTTRTATVYVFNRGTAAATYSVELADRYMLQDGQIRPVTEVTTDADRSVASKVASALPLLTFTPRRITLEPGGSQTVRVRVLRPANLAAGEYRSHLTVSTLPPEDVGLTAEEVAKPGEGQLAVRIVSLFSLSIPVIVRQGDTAAAAGIEHLHLETSGPADKPLLSLDLSRSGVGSVYGDLMVRSDHAAKSAEPLATLGGVAVYPEIATRSVQLALPRVPVPGEHLTVTFVDQDRSPGTVLASGVLTVP
jgi:hypothetical protein